MDTLPIIREKAERLARLLPKSGILSVLRHLELAERHFDTGRSEAETELFTDVIYRANHAFEGVLREAYAILASKEAAGKTAFQIEQYLTTKSVFQDRVMDLFTNYRAKWRNPSTHDHIATFSESEAFLALLSVTSFVGILMDQMISRLAFDEQQRIDAQRIDELREMFAPHVEEPLMDRAVFLLQRFARDYRTTVRPTEVEALAAMCAFLQSAAPELSTIQEAHLEDSLGPMRADLILREKGASVVVELKRYKVWTVENERSAREQLCRYVDAAHATGGILVLLPSLAAQPTAERYDKIIAEHVDNDKIIATIRMLPIV